MKNRSKVYIFITILILLSIYIVYVLSNDITDNPVKLAIYVIALILWTGIAGGLLFALEHKLAMKCLEKHFPEVYKNILNSRNKDFKG